MRPAPITGCGFLCVAVAVVLTGNIVPMAEAIIGVNTSLATVPIGYYGGIASHRGQENIEMLSKARLIIVEKWEGHCWEDCLAGGPGSPSCQPSCGVENAILDTMARVKAINPGVATALYWNTLLAFPFYTAVGKFVDAHAITMDSVTNRPITIENDDDMKGIYVYGFDTDAGVSLFLDTVKNLTSTGLVDGFFGDKWGHGAAVNNTPGADPNQMIICNKDQCGTVTAAQGARWNAGKKKALAMATAYVGKGPFYCEGSGGLFEGVSANLNGHYINWGPLQSGDPRFMIADVKSHLSKHLYMYISCTHDQSWTTDPNTSATLASKCTTDTLARFLLAVEKGCVLGANGWDPAYDRPLGDPLGTAVYTNASAGHPATLHRNFSSGTSVVFTYDESGKDGNGKIFWSDAERDLRGA